MPILIFWAFVLTFLFPVPEALCVPAEVSLLEGISMKMCPPALALAAIAAACSNFCYEPVGPAEALCIECMLYMLSVGFIVFIPI